MDDRERRTDGSHGGRPDPDSRAACGANRDEFRIEQSLLEDEAEDVDEDDGGGDGAATITEAATEACMRATK